MIRVNTFSRRQLLIASGTLSLMAAPGIIPGRLVPSVADQPKTPSADAGLTMKLPGKIYVWASLELTNDNAARERYNGFIFIDPNTGSWHKIAPSGNSLRVSPKGDRLAFERTAVSFKDPRKPDIDDIFVMDTNGMECERLVEHANFPIWSPDGKQVLYHVAAIEDDLRRRFQNWTINLDTKQREQIPVPETDEVDDWTLDGNWLVTVSDRHPPFGSGYQLYVMHPDGTAERRLTEGDGLNCYPRFSPDGKQLVYNHQVHGMNSLWLVDTDGSNGQQIVSQKEDGSGYPRGACWSPDGKWLAVHMWDWKFETKNGKLASVPQGPDEANKRIEIFAPNGASRSILELKNVSKINFMEQPDWKLAASYNSPSWHAAVS